MSETTIKGILAWLPFIVIMAVFIFFVVKARGHNNWVRETCDEQTVLMKKQLEATERQIALLEKIANR